MTIIAALLAAEHELAFLHGSTADDGCRTWSIDHAKTLALIADALSAIGVIRDPVVTVRLVETALRVSPRVEEAALTDCGAARGDSANRSPFIRAALDGYLSKLRHMLDAPIYLGHGR